MSSTNQSPQYQKAQSNFLNAKTNEEKLHWLEEMIRECPKHKSSEKMLANLKTRYIKLEEKIEHEKKVSRGKSTKSSIKKEELQAVIVGFSNVGKSSLLSVLTNMKPEISDYKFTTKFPLVGMMPFSGTNIQVVEIPAIESEYYDKGLVHTADVVVVLLNNLEELKNIEPKLDRVIGKKIFVFNKIDLLSELEKRRLEATLKSKKYNYILISAKERENLNELKEKIFKSFGKIRVYTKEPGKERSQRPFILEENSSIKKVAEKILKGLSERIKETRIWGPSSKFPGQSVGLKHLLKDLDVIEFKTK